MHIFAYGSNNVHPRLRSCFLYSKFTRKFLNNFLNVLSNMSYTLSCRESACKDCGFRVTLSRIVWLIGLTLTLASCRNNILLSVWKFEKLSLRERYFWPNFFQTFKSGTCDTNLRWIAKTLSMSFERSYYHFRKSNFYLLFCSTIWWQFKTCYRPITERWWISFPYRDCLNRNRMVQRLQPGPSRNFDEKKFNSENFRW